MLVEPQPELAAFLVASRKARVFANACSSPANAGRSLPLHVDGPRSVLDRDRDRMSPGAKAAYVIVVPARTLDSILEEAEAPAPIDMLSIDVEGHETEVLRGFDFSRWQPLLILVEDHVNNLQTHRYLKRNGYRLIRRLGQNGWYVPAGEAVTVSSSQRWENPPQILSCAAVSYGTECLALGSTFVCRLVGRTLGGRSWQTRPVLQLQRFNHSETAR